VGAHHPAYLAAHNVPHCSVAVLCWPPVCPWCAPPWAESGELFPYCTLLQHQTSQTIEFLNPGINCSAPGGLIPGLSVSGGMGLAASGTAGGGRKCGIRGATGRVPVPLRSMRSCVLAGTVQSPSLSAYSHCLGSGPVGGVLILQFLIVSLSLSESA